MVLEGHARLTAYMLARDRLPPELEVLVGSSPHDAPLRTLAAGWDRVSAGPAGHRESPPLRPCPSGREAVV